MEYTIIGIEKVEIKNKDNGQTYSGTRLYTTFDNGKEELDGLAVESFYCNARVDLEGVSLGDVCEILYNKYGKVACVKKVG